MRAADRLRPLVPALVVFVTAVACAGALAGRDAPRPDEFHTLSHVGHRTPAELWTSYRGATDATPPFAYLFSWLAARVLGSSLLAVRAPYVVSWGVVAAALAIVTRRAGPWAATAAGLVPTATALVYLGAYARPYAPTLAALGVALVCWDQAGRAHRPVGWLVGLGMGAVVATALHYTSMIALVVLGVVPVLVARGRPDRWARSVVPVAAGAATLAAGLVVLRQALDAHDTLGRSVTVTDIAAFWPNTLRPAVALWLVAIVVVVAGWSARRRAPDRPRVAATPMGTDLLVAGVLLVSVVPVVAVAGMSLTSGVYFHRYAMAGLLGAGILVAAGVERAGRSHHAVGPVVAAVLGIAAVVATARTAHELVSVPTARALPVRLGLDRATADVVVLDEYDYLLLRRYSPELAAPPDARLRLGARAPGVVDSPRPVDLAGWLEGTGPDRFDVVGAPAEIDALIADHPGWAVETVAAATYVRPGAPRQLVHRTFRRSS